MKLKANKKIIGLSLSLVIAAVFLLASPARANWGLDILSGICSAIVGALGWVLVQIMSILVYFAQYNGFITSAAVVNGWVIVRDVCNMFFVLVLLIIAFATILQIEEYNYKKWLPKLILMAVLINFSKTICGLLIDAAQIVMLTFVNSFKDIVGANLTSALGIADWTKIQNVTASDWEVAAVLILAVIYVVIAITVVSAMLAMIAMRIVMIWIFVVLSPIAYLTAAFPGGKSYSSKWWSQFTQNLVVGPVLAFFIWLSFTSLTSFSSSEFMTNSNSVDTSNGSTISATPLGTSNTMVKFVIAIGMLLGGMRIAKEIGGDAADAASSVFQKGNSWAIGAAKWTGGAALLGAKKVATGDNYFARKFAKKTGWDFRPVKLKESFKAAMESGKKKDETIILNKSREHLETGGIRGLAMGMGAGEDYINRYVDGFLGVKGIVRAGKDVFYSPAKRAQLGTQIDEKTKSQKADKEEKTILTEAKKPEMDKAVSVAVEKDTEIINSESKFNSNQAKIDRLNAKKKPLDGKDVKELDDLTKENSEIGTNINSRKKVVEKEALEKFISSDAELVAIDVKIHANEGDLAKLKAEIFKVQKPIALQARSAYRKDIEESKAKYKTITNSDDLQKALVDAKQRGDKFDEFAVMEKLSGDGNLNDEMASKGYASTAVGLYKYVNNEENDFGKKNGVTNVSKAGRLQLLNDLGESEERVNHWDMAKMTGMNNKGEMESLVTKNVDASGKVTYDDNKHATAAYAEVMKMDPQMAVGKLNRLAYGGEDGKGTFQISTLGKMLYKAFSGVNGAFEKHAGRMQSNAAANLSQPHIVPVLEKMLANDKGQSAKIIKAVGERGKDKDVSFKAGDMNRWVQENG